VCLGCGRVDEFHDAEIEARQREVARAIGFGLQEHALADSPRIHGGHRLRKNGLMRDTRLLLEKTQ